MAQAPIMAAGGIVVRGGARPRIAVVQRRKDNGWVLPKGKLKPGEKTCAAARREVIEETGHDVVVHEFLGTLTYGRSRKSKVVQFWRMEAVGASDGKLMRDIKAVRWLPLKAAIDKLDDPVEQVFLSHVGQRAITLSRAQVIVEPASFDTPARPDTGFDVPATPQDVPVSAATVTSPEAAAERGTDIRPTLLQRALKLFKFAPASTLHDAAKI